jgi:hypothetical protein
MIMQNMLMEPVEFKVDQTSFGTWKRHLSVSGSYYAEFVSNARVLGMPLVHYTRGRNPQTGRRTLARGFVAIGRIAVGIFPVGQLAIGVCPVGQLSLGLLLGIGQLTTGVVAIGQMAFGALLGIGQFTTGYFAIGQIAVGYYALGQIGLGAHVWSMRVRDAAARRVFKFLWGG